MSNKKHGGKKFFYEMGKCDERNNRCKLKFSLVSNSSWEAYLRGIADQAMATY